MTLSWDPGQYQRYGGERGRAYVDLVARIGTTNPRTVVDLGCGPGTMTRLLSERWPDAHVLGIDSSAEMIKAAHGTGNLTFRQGTIQDWRPHDVDVIVANASLQWVPGYLDLLPGWAAALSPGGALAFQVPRVRDMPARELFQEVADSPRWADRLAAVADQPGPHGRNSGEHPPEAYLEALAGLHTDAWETTYFHVLPGPDPVLDWFAGTGLRPYLDALADDPDALTAFRTEIAAGLRKLYPARPFGTVLPFPRVFVVATQ